VLVPLGARRTNITFYPLMNRSLQAENSLGVISYAAQDPRTLRNAVNLNFLNHPSTSSGKAKTGRR
jgi:hypothetical protein